jgi:hypothetical protein
MQPQAGDCFMGLRARNRDARKIETRERSTLDSPVKSAREKYSTSVFREYMICFLPFRLDAEAYRDRHDT